MWARPIQALDSSPGSSSGAFFGSFLVGWVRERDDPRDDPERAREFDDRVLVAMDRRYPRGQVSPSRHAEGAGNLQSAGTVPRGPQQLSDQ
jgi:hypothetical protein